MRKMEAKISEKRIVVRGGWGVCPVCGLRLLPLGADWKAEGVYPYCRKCGTSYTLRRS